MSNEKIDNKAYYSAEEKKRIMDMLNEKRRMKENRESRSGYTEKSKLEILTKLNQERVEKEKIKKAAEKRIKEKKVYIFKGKKFYKLAKMDQEYYMPLETYEKLTPQRKVIALYYRIFGELRKKEFLVKIETYSDKIFISSDILRVHYKQYHFEDA